MTPCPFCTQTESHLGTCELSQMRGGPGVPWHYLRMLNPMIGNAHLVLGDSVSEASPQSARGEEAA